MPTDEPMNSIHIYGPSWPTYERQLYIPRLLPAVARVEWSTIPVGPMYDYVLVYEVLP